MSVVIVGSDYLGNLETKLHSFGVTDIVHITGRNTLDRRKISISPQVALVVVFTDFVNHTTAKNIKDTAKSQGIPLVFTKKSWCFLQEKLINIGFLQLISSKCRNITTKL